MTSGIVTPAGSIRLVQVEPGTEIVRGEQKFTVTDEACIFAERHCYVTPAVFDRITNEIARAERDGV